MLLRFVWASVVVVALAMWSHAASANMAKWWHEGEGYGPLIPQDDTAVRVDSEDLSFKVAGSLDRADVSATYRMTNVGAAPTTADVAFVLVLPEYADTVTTEPRAAILVDGAPATFRVVTEAEILEPALEAWLAANRDLEPELDRLSAPTMNPGYPDFAALRPRVPGCAGECDRLLGWYRRKKAPSKYDTEADRKRGIVPAAEEAIPEQVAKLRGNWSRISGQRPLAWLAFRVDFPASATRTVVVSYEHHAGWNARRHVNETFTYDYALSPAKRWASFGDLHVTIDVPKDTALTAAWPLERRGDTYVASYPRLPDGDLSFEVMSRRGLLFGMTQPGGYWLLLVLVLVVVTGAVSVRLGRIWGDGARPATKLRVALACVFGTGLAVALLTALVMGVGTAVMPARALGFGYEPGIGLAFLFLGCVAAGIVTSLVVARRQRRSSSARVR